MSSATPGEVEFSIANGSINVSDPENVKQALQFLYSNIEKSHSVLKVIQTNSDNFFLTVNAVFILMMQAGFGFFEAGSVRGKNVVNMLFKNVLDAFFGGISYWTVGYAFAFGEPCNQFIGMNHFFGRDLASTLYSHWFFHYSFCVTAATIVSGAVAERCEFRGYLCYSLVITGFTYPVITHWAWHNGKSCSGWLAILGYQDFAGSGVVHMTGGACALIACVSLGPRLGRFPEHPGGPYDRMQGHNTAFVVLGAFLLFVGFFAFNGGSQASISVDLDGEQTGRAMMNTVLAGSPAAITGIVLTRFTGSKKWDIMAVLASGLAGMVAICAGCNKVDPWAAMIIGIVSAIITFYLSILMKKLHIDDPVDAIALHLGSGAWGVIAAPIFDRDAGILVKWNQEAFAGLAKNLAGAAAIIAWCGVTNIPMFLILKRIGWLRVDPAVEIEGLDLVKHGESAYPEQMICHHCHKDMAPFEGYDEFINSLRHRNTKDHAGENGKTVAPVELKSAKPAWEPPESSYSPPGSVDGPGSTSSQDGEDSGMPKVN